MGDPSIKLINYTVLRLFFAVPLMFGFELGAAVRAFSPVVFAYVVVAVLAVAVSRHGILHGLVFAYHIQRSDDSSQ